VKYAVFDGRAQLLRRETQSMSGDRNPMATDAIVYKASGASYLFFAFFAAVIAAIATWAGIQFISGIGMPPDTGLWPGIGALACAALLAFLSRSFVRLSRSIQHDVVLTREGVRHGGFVDELGSDFLDWSRILTCDEIQGAILIYTRNIAGVDCLRIDTRALSSSWGLRRQIERGASGELFTAP
jgi:hypothetical protein